MKSSVGRPPFLPNPEPSTWWERVKWILFGSDGMQDLAPNGSRTSDIDVAQAVAAADGTVAAPAHSHTKMPAPSAVLYEPLELRAKGGVSAALDTVVFVPHQFHTSVKLHGMAPTILVSDVAYKKMSHIVTIAGQEVGWLGTVRELPEQGGYLIDDVYLFEQDVSAVSTTISSEGLATFADELLQRPDGADIWEHIRFWGHSHVRMTAEPSSQDDHQMALLRDSGHAYFIRGIVNKHGSMKFWIFFYETGLEFHDVPWQRVQQPDPELCAFIEAEFRTKVRSRRH